MRKKLAFVMTLLLLLGGCRGGRPLEEARPSPTPAVTPVVPPKTPTPQPTPVDTTRAPDFSYDETGFAPWQRAYVAFLEALCGREAPLRADEPQAEELSNGYSLYDVDKDAIPELFVRFGVGEAGYVTQVYAYGRDEVVSIGSFASGHSSLYTCPDENGIFYDWSHMGVHFIDQLRMVEGKLENQGEIFSENLAEVGLERATHPGKVMPGATYLNLFRTTLGLPANAPLTLPIYEYTEGPKPQRTQAERRAAEAAVGRVLAGEMPLYGVSADGYGGDTGWMLLADYCVSPALAETPRRLEELAWCDLDGDGQEECVLRLVGESGESYSVLSLQDGVVYAYSLNYSERYVLRTDGVFAWDEAADGMTLHCSKNQSVLCYGQRPDESVPPVAWVAPAAQGDGFP